jgi:SAM-dependent methyltransferase
MTVPDQTSWLSDVPNTAFPQSFREATQRLDQYIGALALEVAFALEIEPSGKYEPESLTRDRNWRSEGLLALRWLFETLELYGFAARKEGAWQLDLRHPILSADQLRQRAEEAIPATRPAYELMEISARNLPALLRGEIRGEDVLFSPATLGLWFDYVANTNPHYGPNNAFAALASERAVGRDARLFEVGGGGGGAAEAIVQALTESSKPPLSYTFTDIHPAFLRRGTRIVQKVAPPGCEVRSGRFDINLPADTQGFAGQLFDAVIAVNTLHLAQDLVACLRSLGTMLVEDGALIIGELIRPPYGNVHLELPFTLLEAYRTVQLDEVYRPRPGFVTLQGWREALARAGFTDIILVPAELNHCVEEYPGFYCAAITARH